jgi:hypothetical protein
MDLRATVAYPPAIVCVTPGSPGSCTHHMSPCKFRNVVRRYHAKPVLAAPSHLMLLRHTRGDFRLHSTILITLCGRGSGTPPGSASSGEADQYYVQAQLLRILGAKIEAAPVQVTTDSTQGLRESVSEPPPTVWQPWGGIPVSLGPAIVLSPFFGSSLADLRRKLPSPDKIAVSARSTLLVQVHGGAETFRG